MTLPLSSNILNTVEKSMAVFVDSDREIASPSFVLALAGLLLGGTTAAGIISDQIHIIIAINIGIIISIIMGIIISIINR